ncbi:MAG: hypothetical protein K2X81_25680, partial [Candidatus Obscuribacterales bacterium]|nr:hypothetical protein [Candidatus Obscuribacterales bacterium]
GDKDGNWTENKFDPSGKSTGSVEHKVGPDGTYKETEKNAEGKVTRDVNGDKNGKNTNTYDKDGKQISAVRENNDGSAVGWNKNADGTQTNFEQKDKDHREETITKDGSVIGSRKISKDENGQNTDTFDKDGKQTSAIRENKDGSSVGWNKNPDGTQTNFEQKDKDHREETITKDGQVIGSQSIVKDANGVNTNTFDKDGKQSSGLRQNNDGSSTGWKKNPDGSTTTTDINAQGIASENVFDDKGNMLSSAERNTKTGEYSQKNYKDGKVTLKTHTKDAQGVFVDETRELS